MNPDELENQPTRRFCIAPMMDVTDRHCRYFLRLLTRRALLYTEMVSTGALLHGERARLLRFDPIEQPLALQLGGSDPQALARCAIMAEEAGYAEVNLNVGCPSDRVQHNRIGACLMAEPLLVADCVAAMRAAVAIPVTVKCRTGIDGRDSLEELIDFIATVAGQGGCRSFIVHARIAVLAGLSPKQNREIPPLDYARVYAVKAAFPALEIIINGGITSLKTCHAHLDRVDGVMLGREAWHNPWLLREVDSLLFGDPPTVLSRAEALEPYFPYVQRQLDEGLALHHLTRHILGLFQGQPGGRHFRRHLSEHAHRPGAGLQVLRDALSLTRKPQIETGTTPACASS